MSFNWLERFVRDDVTTQSSSRRFGGGGRWIAMAASNNPRVSFYFLYIFFIHSVLLIKDCYI